MVDFIVEKLIGEAIPDLSPKWLIFLLNYKKAYWGGEALARARILSTPEPEPRIRNVLEALIGSLT